MTKTLILDNGASTMKVGLAHHRLPKIVPNVILRGRNDRRHYIADQVDECTDFSSLLYRLAFEKGYLTNWGLERTIWDRVFKQVVKIDTKDTQLIITEPLFNLTSIQEAYDQIIFEEYEFQSCYRTTGPQLCIYNDWYSLFGGDIQTNSIPDCALIVDSGYSFTHIIPFFQRKPITKAIRRINVGGKLLTNQLKETVSFRYYDMMEETYIINDVKEASCYVSQNAMHDLDICRLDGAKNTIVQDFVLPDFTTTTRGHVRPHQMQSKNSKIKMSTNDDDQVLVMNNERFMIPELLMHPSDIGMQQAGIPETIMQSIQACDPELHGLLYANIVLVGGNAKFNGYQQRIETDLRQMAPSIFDIRVTTPIEPVIAAWMGGQRMFSNLSKSESQQMFVTRKEYMEYGSDICRRKFSY
ncbi:actin family [Halteromyces radiatus]|uniref:actin family n=1 Tax=Halteromyces radiatus TaxID=101107 RepID=UPI00221F3DAE|nr:actin family [Halteromyces radiatus]KAI8080074.1 actin family [Halteromyces radiatus]